MNPEHPTSAPVDMSSRTAVFPSSDSLRQAMTVSFLHEARRAHIAFFCCRNRAAAQAAARQQKRQQHRKRCEANRTSFQLFFLL